MKKLLVSTAISTFIAVPALAGSLDQPVVEDVVIAPAPAPVALGYDWTGFYGGLSLGTGSGEIESDTLGDEDFDVNSYGLYGGYMYDSGTLVYGGELDYSSLDLEGDSGEDEDGDIIRLKGRLGYDAGRFLPYATVGVANLNIDDESGSGWVYGVGAEYAVTDSVRVRGEYLAHDFEDFGDDDDFDVNANTFNIGVAYAF